MGNSHKVIVTAPQVHSGPLITGGALVAAGGLLALAGVVIGGGHLVTAIRRWVRDMDVPPSELARLKLAQARAAASAGADAWQNGPQARSTR
jgi:uncharacterized protein (DUF1786 family)